MIRNGALKFITGSKFPKILGVDYSGVIKEISATVKGFKVGDSVYGATNALSRKQQGALCEIIAVSAKKIRLIPPGLSFEGAASLPVGAITALSGLKKCGILDGKSVLVIGATGGVGHFAVQIAKARGAEVTGACNTRNIDIAKSLGCDFVIDYTKGDISLSVKKYDVIYDSFGHSGFSGNSKALNAYGQYVTPTLYPPKLIMAFFQNMVSSKKCLSSNMQPIPENYAEIEQLIQLGFLKPLIERIFPLPDGAEALKILEQGKVRGKVVVKV
jgi:NADPH:quinone reductase-like Zn-dependent oxidoreductase